MREENKKGKSINKRKERDGGEKGPRAEQRDRKDG